MGMYPENPGALPALEFCNRTGKKDPVCGKGPLGNQYSGKMSYSGADRTDQVTTVQKMLMELGYEIGSPEADGKFGNATEEGLRNFQKEHADWEGTVLDPDGLVGPRTSDALNREMVGRWYDAYATPPELTGDTYCYTAVMTAVSSGLEITPGEAKTISLFIVRPSPGGFVPWIDFQTVDDLGHRMGGATLVLRYPDGSEKEMVTDEKGYHREKKVPRGTIPVMLPDGTPAKMRSGDEERDAVIDTESARIAIVNIIAGRRAPDEVTKHREMNRKIYRRVPPDRKDLDAVKITARRMIRDPDTGEFSGDDKKLLPRRSAFAAFDNLSLAAGWKKNESGGLDVDLPGFFGVLSRWLADYFPVALMRGYIVYLLSGNELVTCDSTGTVLGKCRLITELEGRLFGAYSTFAEKTGPLFVDMMNRKYTLREKGNPSPVGIEEIVEDTGLMEKIHQEHLAQVKILYCLPSGQELFSLATLGGTGELEDYGQDSGLNSGIHKRNMAVVRTVHLAYQLYLENYISIVKGKENIPNTQEKVTDENGLRKLGPPREPYIFPAPAGATEEQMTELFEANITSGVRAWQAIAERLARFAGDIPEGSFFVSVKVETDKLGDPESPLISGGSARLNFYLENDLTPVLMEPETEVKIGAEGEKTIRTTSGKEVKVGFAHERKLNPKTGQTDESYKVKAGAGEIEISPSGDGKLEVGLGKAGGAYAEMSRKSAQFGMGGYISIGENQKLYIGIHFQGLKDDTLLAYTCRGVPGFFQRRSTDELMSPRTQWGDLHLDEAKALEAIGFTRASWDARSGPGAKLPAAITKSFDDLTPAQKCAAVVLGLRRSTWDEAWKKIRPAGGAAAPEA